MRAEMLKMTSDNENVAVTAESLGGKNPCNLHHPSPATTFTPASGRSVSFQNPRRLNIRLCCALMHCGNVTPQGEKSADEKNETVKTILGEGVG